MKKLFLLLALLFPIIADAQAQVGYFQRDSCSTLTPVNNKTLCLQQTTTGGRTAGRVYIYRGSAWVDLSDTAAPSGSANTPLFNNGSGGFTNGTRSGNTTKVATATGSPATDDCAKWDADGNLTTAGAACGSGGGGGGDASTNTSSSVDSEIALFSSTGGKTLKRATTSGVLKGTSGVIGAAASTDVVTLFGSGSCSGYLKSDGTCDTPSGGGGGLTLVQSQTVTSGQTNVDFSGLDGNTDGVYLLQGNIITTSCGANPIFTIQPNAVTTNQISSRFFWNNGGTAGTDYTNWFLNTPVDNSRGSFEVAIYARNNPNGVPMNRSYEGRWSAVYSSKMAVGTVAGEWQETSTNLTSLRIHSDTSSCISSGSQIFLYKYAQ